MSLNQFARGTYAVKVKACMVLVHALLVKISLLGFCSGQPRVSLGSGAFVSPRVLNALCMPDLHGFGKQSTLARCKLIGD